MEPTIRLNDGRVMPRLGLGTWQMSNAEAADSVNAALTLGYRLIDTAAIYENETGVGRGLKSAGLKREEIFVTTKLWNDRHAAGPAAMQESLTRLGLGYVDLYLIHWPCAKQGRFLEAWRSLIALQKAGLARSIGVSNFNVDHLERIIGETGVVPVLNQIELHPEFQQAKLRAFHAQHGIVTQAWSPLGRGGATQLPAIATIAKRLGRTAAQVILRWQLQLGLSTIPKSVSADRIRENAAVYDFALSGEDLSAIGKLESGRRLGPDPAAFG
jgi:2,5-diketo-D-gluconate reductase A